MQYNFVGVDTETTGLNHQNDEILEVAATEFNLSGDIGESIHFLCKPLLGYIPIEITKINGITWDMVKNEPNYLKDGIREKVAKFFGKRTIVGHNIIEFDIKFLRIKAKRMEDTLVMCRSRYRGGNNLKTACQRGGIEWKDRAAHRAEYDVKKCIELFLKLKNIENKEMQQNQEKPLFAKDTKLDQKVRKKIGVFGVIPTEADKKMLATQAYSYSRINLFHQCKFKWYMQYIKKIKEPEKDYLVTGKICHKIAEWSGEWCYRELLANKLVIYAQIKHLTHLAHNVEFDTDSDLISKIVKEFSIKPSEATFHHFGYYLYKYPQEIKKYFPKINGLAGLIYEMDKTIENDSYEKPSMPDRKTYDEIIKTAITNANCTDPDIIRDVKHIMDRFYNLKDFALIPGDIILTEKRLAFDRDWKILSDFFSNRAFMRGIIDVITYLGNYVVITDYKSSRKMATVQQLKEDMQMKTYVLFIYNFLPKDSYHKIIVRVEYIRFGKTIEYEIVDVKSVAEEALAWINNSIQQIETEMMITDGHAFEPTRNEYCHTCFLGEEGKCPLFDKQFINKIDNVNQFIITDIEDCQTAWKRIEANKAENTRLANLCKSFVKSCTNEIRIDEHAVLDYYISEYKDFHSLNTMKLLLEKKVPIEQIIRYFSISSSSFEALLEKTGTTFSDEELDSISKKKYKTKFDAFTLKEAKNKNYINA